MTEENCIIVGASHAGCTLALQLRREGWQGNIHLISEESELPYHRPPLSKEFLAGNQDLDTMRLRPLKVYQDNDVHLHLGSAVKSIDRQSRRVELSDGSELDYRKLALCTGARVRRLPTNLGRDSEFYIRSVDDTRSLLHETQAGKRVVIIGAGYIGLEAAAVLVQKGLKVTVLEMAKRILARVTGKQLSEYMASLHRSHGVQIVTGAQVTEIRGLDFSENSRVGLVSCADGTSYEADFVVAGIGIEPESTLAETAGLAVQDGIVVDTYAQTSDPDIFAAGDCTSHPSAIYKRQLRLESVQNATDQARVAAANICGKQVAYNAVPWFWSDQYDKKIQIVGLSQGFDLSVCRGQPDIMSEQGFSIFYLQDGAVIAADCVGRPREFMVSKQLVTKAAKIDPALLADESIDPSDFLK